MIARVRALWMAYVTGQAMTAILGTGARVFALGSQVILLIVLSRLLPKAEFGDAMTVFTLYRLISLGLGSGLGSVVLYHVARSGGDHALDIRLMRSTTVMCLTLGGLLAVGAISAATAIAAAFGKPGLAPWIVNLSPMLPFGALIQISASSFDGRSKVSRSIAVTELAPNVIRLLGLVIVAILGLSSLAIAVVLWAALALPWAWDSLRLMDSTVSGFEKLQAWDLKYALWLGIYPLAGQQLQGIDMLLVGAFFSSEVAAEYSIASRLASFYPFLQQIVVRIVTPQSGALMRAQETDRVNDQMQDLRANSLFLTAALAGLIILCAPIVTYISGSYADAIPIMIVLAIPPVIRSMYSGIDIVLRMRGHGGVVAMVAISSAAVLCFGSWGLKDYLGIYALPFSMAISAAAINAFIAAWIEKGGVRVAEYSGIISIVFVCGLLILIAHYLLPYIAALAASVCLFGLAGSVFQKTRLTAINRSGT